VNAQQVVSQYELLATLSGEMRAAADQGEWDKLIELEAQCSRHIASMQSVEQNAVLDESSRQHTMQLVRKIIANDSAIRNCTENWMQQMQLNLQSNRQEQRINQAYGAI
jgi:flagellar protein FliT